ncbi:MAG: M23 family metallopeptidase [Fibromonadaceae bacterium]|jgi:murein DD-endopeptidase MepM/ murein hydrolase activator NlpD|nr:M23 family metallopeptidase [Fibromonadaceae bacterium]
MPKKRKKIQIQIYSKGTNKPEYFTVPVRIIAWWLAGLAIIILGFMLWLPDNMINLKNFRVFEIAKEQRAMQLSANRLEKQIAEANSQIESGRNLRNKINQLAGISSHTDELKGNAAKSSKKKDDADFERIKRTLKTMKKLRNALLEDEEYASSLPLLHPVKKNQNITNRFGLIQDQLTKRELPHRGLDFAISEGDTVIATGNGTVRAITNQRFGFGTSLEIQHTPDVKTVYSHLQSVLVQPGKQVKKGQPVAIAGRSGSVLWPVLHYEVHFDNQPINPEDYFITR